MWTFVQNPQPPTDDELSDAEAMFLNAVFGRSGGEVSLPRVKQRLRGPLKTIAAALYAETIERGWYRRHPRSRGFLGLAGRAPRTADGTAVRIQTLGFRKYLATAEAKQIKFEEAAELFNRYLPYAMIFGLADRWAKVIGDVAREARLEGVGDLVGGLATDPLFWMFYGDDLAYLGIEALGGLGDLFTGVGDLFDVGDLAGGVGDLLGSVGDAVGDVIGDVFDF